MVIYIIKKYRNILSIFYLTYGVFINPVNKERIPKEEEAKEEGAKEEGDVPPPIPPRLDESEEGAKEEEWNGKF